MKNTVSEIKCVNSHWINLTTDRAQWKSKIRGQQGQSSEQKKGLERTDLNPSQASQSKYSQPQEEGEWPERMKQSPRLRLSKTDVRLQATDSKSFAVPRSVCVGEGKPPRASGGGGVNRALCYALAGMTNSSKQVLPDFPTTEHSFLSAQVLSNHNRGAFLGKTSAKEEMALHPEMPPPSSSHTLRSRPGSDTSFILSPQIPISSIEKISAECNLSAKVMRLLRNTTAIERETTRWELHTRWSRIKKPRLLFSPVKQNKTF